MKDLSFCFGVIVSWIRNKRKFVFCAEFMNDKIIEHEVRQACNAWILELLYRQVEIQESLLYRKQ